MQHSNRFFNGFIFGAIIGAAVVFLLGTEKGKKVLKLITEEGLQNISELIEENESNKDILEEVEPVEEVIETSEDLESKQPIQKSTKKRFFRRIKK